MRDRRGGKRNVRIVGLEPEVLSGGGQLSVTGYLSYQHGLYADLALKGKSIRIRYPQGVSSAADISLQLQGPQNNLLLSGNVMITRFTVSPELDLVALASQSTKTSTIQCAVATRASSWEASPPGTANQFSIWPAVRRCRAAKRPVVARDVRQRGQRLTHSIRRSRFKLGRWSVTTGYRQSCSSMRGDALRLGAPS